MSHPYRDGEGLLQAGAHHAVRDLDGLGTIELKHLVAVVSIVSRQPDRPVDGAAGCREELHCAGAGSWWHNNKEKRNKEDRMNSGLNSDFTVDDRF